MLQRVVTCSIVLKYMCAHIYILLNIIITTFFSYLLLLPYLSVIIMYNYYLFSPDFSLSCSTKVPTRKLGRNFHVLY